MGVNVFWYNGRRWVFDDSRKVVVKMLRMSAGCYEWFIIRLLKDNDKNYNNNTSNNKKTKKYI